MSGGKRSARNIGIGGSGGSNIELFLLERGDGYFFHLTRYDERILKDLKGSSRISKDLQRFARILKDLRLKGS